MKKQVVVELPSLPLIATNEGSDDKFYGIDFPSKRKGFITQDSDSDFIAIDADKTTKGEIVDSASGLSELLSNLLSDECFVYQFDTAKELFKWLSE